MNYRMTLYFEYHSSDEGKTEQGWCRYGSAHLLLHYNKNRVSVALDFATLC